MNINKPNMLTPGMKQPAKLPAKMPNSMAPAQVTTQPTYNQDMTVHPVELLREGGDQLQIQALTNLFKGAGKMATDVAQFAGTPQAAQLFGQIAQVITANVPTSPIHMAGRLGEQLATDKIMGGAMQKVQSGQELTMDDMQGLSTEQMNQLYQQQALLREEGRKDTELGMKERQTSVQENLANSQERLEGLQGDLLQKKIDNTISPEEELNLKKQYAQFAASLDKKNPIVDMGHGWAYNWMTGEKIQVYNEKSLGFGRGNTSLELNALKQIERYVLEEFITTAKEDFNKGLKGTPYETINEFLQATYDAEGNVNSSMIFPILSDNNKKSYVARLKEYQDAYALGTSPIDYRSKITGKPVAGTEDKGRDEVSDLIKKSGVKQ